MYKSWRDIINNCTEESVHAIDCVMRNNKQIFANKETCLYGAEVTENLYFNVTLNEMFLLDILEFIHGLHFWVYSWYFHVDHQEKKLFSEFSSLLIVILLLL